MFPPTVNKGKDIWLANISFHLMDCLFILLMVSSLVQKIFSLMLSLFLIFAFLVVPNANNHYQDLSQMLTHLCFLLGVCGFRSYLHVFNPSWVNFCVWYKILTGVQFHSSVCSCLVSPVPFIEENALFLLYSLDSFLVN